MVSVSHSFPATGALADMAKPGGVLWQSMQRTGIKLEAFAKDELTKANRVDTGRLRNSIESRVFSRGDEVGVRVGTNIGYARYVHDGTTGPILPTTARVLRFKPKGSGAFVFADSVRGTRETGNFTPFLQNALNRLGGDFIN